MAERRNSAFASHSDYFVTLSGAMGLLATSFMTTWPSLAATSRINHEIRDEDHGTANLEISLSLMTSMTQYKVGGAEDNWAHQSSPGRP